MLTLMKKEISYLFLQYSSFIETIPLRITRGEGQMLYHGRNEVWKIINNGLSYVVKIFKRVNDEQQIVYTLFRPSKAVRSFHIAKEFRSRGIRTPHEIAYIEIYERGLFSMGYFISEEAKGIEVSHGLLERGIINEPLAKAVIQHVIAMHSKGVLHGDLNLNNILYEQQLDGTYVFTMVDVNSSMLIEGWPDDNQCLRNIVRITYNSELYKYLVRSYAELRGWDANSTIEKALYLQRQFMNRWLK